MPESGVQANHWALSWSPRRRSLGHSYAPHSRRREEKGAGHSVGRAKASLSPTGPRPAPRPHPRAGPGQSRAPRGLPLERPRTPARRSGRLRTYRPGGRPPSGSGTARSSGPSGLREGGGAGNPSQRGTQRNRKGSPRRTKQLPGPLVLSTNRKSRRVTEPGEGPCARREGSRVSESGVARVSPLTRSCGGCFASRAQALRASPLWSRSSRAGPPPPAAGVGLKGTSALKPWWISFFQHRFLKTVLYPLNGLDTFDHICDGLLLSVLSPLRKHVVGSTRNPSLYLDNSCTGRN
ncbi:serine/arginine repetitive matrix protein 2-like [Mustela putorius furo]|uniref:Serine/arginine repetitive matrix protein 2-like n=1 Tax=Mustela putorius furo TaxID=9669 RepID=A0A8U0SCT9_MUSPF|nr:serine/arginine repetitive matrix protein 2-like [Mustela putorius furo]